MAVASRVFAAFLALFLIQLDYQVNAEDLASSGAAVTLGGIPYYIPGKPIASEDVKVYATCSSRSQRYTLGLVPITVVDLSSATSSLATLETTVAAFEKQDDVWTEAFLSGSTPAIVDTILFLLRQSTNRVISQLFSSKVCPKKF